jgi:hypothetical protein
MPESKSRTADVSGLEEMIEAGVGVGVSGVEEMIETMS